MPWLIMGIYLALYFLVGAIFYIRMRKVGSLLGGNYKARMDVALTLLIIIPLALSFLSFFFQMIGGLNPSLGIDTGVLSGLASIAVWISFVSGAMLLPGILIAALKERGLGESAQEAPNVKEPSFEEKIEAIRNRNRADREASNKPVQPSADAPAD